MKNKPNADFVKWLKEHEQLDYESAKHSISWISDAHTAWQSCQRLNDARINTLNAAITEDNISSAHTKALQSENERLRAQVEDLLAVVAVKDEALDSIKEKSTQLTLTESLTAAVDRQVYEINKISVKALALKPSDVELVEVGTVASQSTYLDEVLFSPDKNTSRVEVGAKLYVLKQKEGK